VASNGINITSISRLDQVLESRTLTAVISNRGSRVPKHGDKKRGARHQAWPPKHSPLRSVMSFYSNHTTTIHRSARKNASKGKLLRQSTTLMGVILPLGGAV
jgi:hypothetical protein